MTSDTKMRGSKRKATSKPAKGKGKTAQGHGHKGGGAKASETRVRPPRHGRASTAKAPRSALDEGGAKAADQPSGLGDSGRRFFVSSAIEYVSRVKGALFLGNADSLSPSARRESLVQLRDYVDSMISGLPTESDESGESGVPRVVVEYDPGQGPADVRNSDGDEDVGDVATDGGSDDDEGDEDGGDEGPVEYEDEDPS